MKQKKSTTNSKRTNSRSKNVIAFINLLLLSSLIYTLAGAVLYYATDTRGALPLARKQLYDGFYFFTVLSLVVIQFIVIRRLWRKKMRYAAVGLAVTFIFGFYSLIRVSPFFLSHLYSEKFDMEVWQQGDPYPMSMAKTIVKEKTLVGKNREEVIALLGEGIPDNYGYQENSLTYRGKRDLRIKVMMKNDIVIEVLIWVPGEVARYW